MPPTTTLFRAARPIFQQSASRAVFRSSFPQTGRRFASTATNSEAASQSWFQRMWNSPVGLKTVHFWAPVMKWAIVIAGISDFARPAEKLSLTQNGALTATGLIWTRWCFVITPQNYLLAAVNFFLGLVGITQCARIFLYRSSQKNLPAAAESEAKEAVKS
ncbi:UPF0041-domain-containing protein [Annulohypoxylon truncatum]|uniref:UPF0041-domain-containing protein n=1 Tax=Annulohypoxylon truncatum TaxID=327061 RepID=UPI0020078CE2|nr:UPF0041-domain-containing protein [Annulohypoxylon truncatum]KAI1212558.1 UPF0041-domain-containing protein [Annulohypoxylon truncatum]